MNRAEQFRRNIDHASAVFALILADPSLADRIPDGVGIVPMPARDMELQEANLQMIARLHHRSAQRTGREDAAGALFEDSTLLVSV